MTFAAPLKLSGEQTLRTVAVTAERLRAHVSGQLDTVLDVRGVTEADVSFVQLVLAARKFALANGGHLRLSAPADGPLLACLRAGGFLPETRGDVRGPLDFWMAQGDQ